MKAEEINQGMHLLGESLISFRERFFLPDELFIVPDHFAIKCGNEIDYRNTCNEVQNWVNVKGIWQIEIDDRFLASAELEEQLEVGGFVFPWIEIMQPRPGKEQSNGLVEHVEFTVGNLQEARRHLESSGIVFTEQENPGHRWLNIVIDEEAREVKLNDKSLAVVTKEEKAQGKLKRLVTNGD